MGGKKKQTTGYRYGLTVHMGVCYGPVDRVDRILADDRNAYTAHINDSSIVTINKPNLFGGDKKEGGLLGSMEVQMGKPTQSPSPYLMDFLGSNIPAFRGILSFIFKGIMSANNPYLKAFSFVVRRVKKGWHNDDVWYEAKALVNNRDANPAHIIYECLTNPKWGMGYPPSAIDDANFKLAADKLYSEGFGLSLLWNQQNTIDAFLSIIFSHINGQMRSNPKTGLIQLKLLRDDFDIEDIPVFDESNIADLTNYQRAGYAELVNEITLKHTDPSTYKETAVTVQNLAAIEAQGGVINQTLSYTGITNPKVAQRVAQRELISRSSPLAKIEIQVNRTGWNLLAGDVFKFVWPKLGITGIVMRIASIGMGTLASGTIKVEAIEDVFGLPDSSYVEQEESGWVDPLQEAQPSPNRKLVESTYYDLVSTLTQADLAYVDPTDGYPVIYASRSSVAAYDYSLLTAIHGSTTFKDVDKANHCPMGVILTAMTKEEHTVIEISTDQADKILINEFAIINDEYFRIDGFDTLTNMLTIARGVIDTVPAAHIAGSMIYFAEGDGASDPNAWVEGTLVDAKVITRTGMGELDQALAPIDTIEINARHFKPYPPGRFRINTEYMPGSVSGIVSISWEHRNRLIQDTQLLAQDEASVAPETGTTYTIKVYDQADVLCRTLTGITANNYIYPVDDELTDCGGMQSHLRIELFSVRDGIESWQMHSHRFERVYTGWGFNWGDDWGNE